MNQAIVTQEIIGLYIVHVEGFYGALAMFNHAGVANNFAKWCNETFDLAGMAARIHAGNITPADAAAIRLIRQRRTHKAYIEDRRPSVADEKGIQIAQP